MRVSVVKEKLYILRNLVSCSGFSFCIYDASLRLRGSEGRSQGRYEEGRTQRRSRRIFTKSRKQPRRWHRHGQPRRRVREASLRRPLLSQVNLGWDLVMEFQLDLTLPSNNFMKFIQGSEKSLNFLSDRFIKVRSLSWWPLSGRNFCEEIRQNIIFKGYITIHISLLVYKMFSKCIPN